MCRRIKCKDHLGNEFPSIKAMCRHWGINHETYKCRIKIGCSVKNALTEPLMTKKEMSAKAFVTKKQKGSFVQAMDHLGQRFACFVDMCRHWKIPDRTGQYRIDHGWSVKETLTTPVIQHKEPIDHLGNRFNTIKEMCKFYNIKPTTFNNRIRYGWSLKDCLTAPIVINKRRGH